MRNPQGWHDEEEEDEGHNNSSGEASSSSSSKGGRGGGFKTTKTVRVDVAPVIQSGVGFSGKPMGGVQGLDWYCERLKRDEDGDLAEEFLDEAGLAASSSSSSSTAGLRATPAGLGRGFSSSVAPGDRIQVRGGNVLVEDPSQRR